MTTPIPVPLNMEEQLKLLQQQHQFQLQSLGMTATPVDPQSQVPVNDNEASVVPTTQTALGANYSAFGSVGIGSIPYVNPHSSVRRSDLTSSQNSRSSSVPTTERNSASPQPLPSVSSAPLLEFSSSQQPSQEPKVPSEGQNQTLLDLQSLLQPPSNEDAGLATPLNPVSPPHSGMPVSPTSISTMTSVMPGEGGSRLTYSQASPTHTMSTYLTPAQNEQGEAGLTPRDSSLNQVSLPQDSETDEGKLYLNLASSTAASEPTPLLQNFPSGTQDLHHSPGYAVSEETRLPGSAIANQEPASSNLSNATGLTTTINSISRPIPAPVVTPPSSPCESTEPETNWSIQEHEVSHPGQIPIEAQDNNAQDPMQGDTVEHFHAATDLKEGMVELKTSDDILELRRDHAADSRTSTPQLSEFQSSVSSSFSSLPTVISLSTTSGIGPLSELDLSSHAIDTDLHSLPQLSDLPFRATLPGLSSISLQAPSSMSPISLDAGPSHSMMGATLGGQMEHLHALLASNKTLQQSVDDKTREIEQNKATVADQKSQLENYKQQLLILQQQLSQVSFQQHKQEQEKATASGQQAVLMQLLQQQQGMFSQQQAQIEKLSKATELHRLERVDTENKHKQALSVEQERIAGLNTQNMQLNQEVQRLQQQLQSSNQQQHVAQIQLYQLQSQVQERDKHIVAFREQHKHIIQNLEQRHQQKMAQMVQQIQDLQADNKRIKSQKHSSRPLQSPLSTVPTGPGRKGDISYQQTSPMLPPISTPQQQSSSSFMPSPSNTPSTPNSGFTKVDLMTPMSARTHPPNVQVPTLQPTKVHSPQLPPMTALETQSTPGNNQVFKPPPKPQLLVGPQQQRMDSPQATPDGMNRSLSWNVGQQQLSTAVQPQGNQQQHGTSANQPPLQHLQQKPQPIRSPFQEQMSNSQPQPQRLQQNQLPSQPLPHTQGIQGQQQHLQREGQMPSQSPQDISQRRFQAPQSGMYQPPQQQNASQMQGQQQGMPQQSQPQGTPQMQNHLQGQQQSVPRQQGQQHNVPQLQSQQPGMPQQQGPSMPQQQQQQRPVLLSGMPQLLQPLEPQQQMSAHGATPTFSQSHGSQPSLSNAQSAPHSMAGINSFQVQG